MSVPSMRDGVNVVAESIGRGKGTFVLARTVPSDGASKPFALAAGSINVIRVNGGFMVSIGLSRKQVEALRSMCDEALAEQAP